MDVTISVPSGHSSSFRLEWRSLVELLRSRAETEGERKLYTFLSEGPTPERSLSYAELDRQARAIGACLQNANANGQRVLLLFPPGLDYIAAFFGCLFANAIAVPAYPPRQNRNLDRLRAVVSDARPAIALTTQGVITEIESGLGDYPDLKALQWIAADRVESDWAGEWRDLNADASTLAFLQYTSGSTANPKGVMVSHGNLLHNEELIQRAFGQSSTSIIVGWLPLFHDMGLIGNVIQPLYAAAECVLFSPMTFLQRPFRWLEAISRYRATTSGGPNFAYDLCARKISPEDRATLDLSSWNVAFNGAEPVRKETIDRFCAAFESCGFRREAFFPCYGLAEATLFVAGGPGNSKPVVQAFQRAALDQNRVVAASNDEHDVRSLVGCGYAYEQQVLIVDPETNALCKREQVGEIWVNSESVAQGYWNQPGESDRIFNAHLEPGAGPYLRTGDLGFIDGGQLYITGRLKDLIIIRGRNCYPEDIEHTIGQCDRALRPGEGVVFSTEIEGDERLIVVHEVARDYRGDDLPKVVENVRRRVAEEHDLQLFHVALIQTGTLLRTSSGKIRRQAMKKVFLEEKLRVLYQWRHSQRQEIETVETAAIDLETTREWIATRVAAVVGVTRIEIDCDAPVVRYGMDSLACMELAHSIEANLGVALPVTTLLSDLSVSDIAQRVFDQCQQPDQGPIVQPAVITPETAFPLSDGQAALWFLHRLAPQSAAYNVVGAARLRGEVDAAILRSAFQALVDRHPMLRARFESRGGEPAQVIQDTVTLFFQQEDLSALSETDLRSRLASEARRPFDLESGPLIRLALFTRNNGDRLLMLVAHHIVIDMWSVAVLVNELKSICEAAACGEFANLLAPQFSYQDFVAWQQQELAGPHGQQLQQYWQTELSGELPVLNLNTDHPRPYLQTYEGASESIRLGDGSVNRLQELARDNLLPIHSLLLAVYAALLYRHTNQEEVIVGCPASGRTDLRFQPVVGYFVNPLPIRIRLDGTMTFRQLLTEVRQTVQRAFAHQDYPFSRIVDDVSPDRDPSRSPVFQTTFVFEQPPRFIDQSLAAFALGEEQAQLTLGPLTLESVRTDQAISQFDLSMLVAPFKDDLSVALQYNTSLFEPATIEKMLEHFRVLVDEVTAHPDQRILDLPILTKGEQQQLLVEFNDTESDYTRHDYVHQLFEAQVEKTPEAIALFYEGGAASYRELNAKANRLAHHLRAAGVGPDARVAILLPRSLEMIAAMLGVLKAGGAYVPLDPAYPVDRLSFMLEDSEAPALICQDTLAHHLADHRAKVINLDSDKHLIAQQSENNPQPCVKSENLSHVIYTSGSTGRPKGVAIEHGNVIHFLHWAHQTFTSEELSGVLAATSICFDLSVFEIFAPLACGGTIILANDALHLATHPAAASVTLINTVPSAMTGLLRLGAVHPNVLTINLAGEALKNSLVQQIYEETDVGRVLNLYGPTEYTTYTTGVEVQRGSSKEPTIGKPIANTRVHIVNENGGLVPVGVVGEICIGGQGLARGYLSRPEMTAEKFIPDNFSLDAGSRLYRTGDLGRYLENGEIEYLGRMDHQIKLRGYRIELGEIESALLRYPGIKEAVVVAREDHVGESQLVAYLVNEMDQHASNDDLRYYLRQTLPSFMVPQFFVSLAKMPLTSNGKVNRLLLPAPQETSVTERVKPLGPIEEVVASIWAEVLGIDQIGATDNFFDIGGQSLKAVQVVARVLEVLRVELPVTTIFEAPTVQALASVVERSITPEGSAAISHIERVSRDSSLPLSFAQQRLWFLQSLEPSSAAYNISFSARFVGPVNLPAIEQSINEIVRRHESLRTTFAEVDGDPVQIIASTLTVLPSILNLDHLNESERQTERQRLLHEEARRPFDLENGPLLRTLILRLSQNECVVNLSMHHAISDGWSGGVFIRELIGIYEASSNGQPSQLPPLTVQYADFAHWQRLQQQHEDFEPQLSYWRRQLSAAPQLELPTRTRSAMRTEQGSVLRFNLPEELVQKLRALSRRNGATLFMTLLASLQVLLSRYSGQTDVSVGTPVANRNSSEIEPLIGCFVNTLVMRTDLSGDPSFRELLERVREVALGAYTHSSVPFERLVAELQPDRDLSRTPLFQVMMVLQNTPQQPLVLDGLHCQIEETDNETAKFDLTVQLTESEAGLDGKWEYSTDLFDAATIQRMATHFRGFLETVVENEHRHISEIPILTDEEQSQLKQFNETQLELTPSSYLHQAFETQVEKTPDAVALVYGTASLTYQELNRRANRLAHYLQTLSIGPESRVALLLERTPELIVSMLAVLKAGGAYLPLDLAYPAERLSFMIEDAHASMLICRDESNTFSKHAARVVNLDLESQLIDEQSSDNPVSGVEPENLSHVIYTSGSTGKPKGVAIEHRSVINFLQWARNTFSTEELAAACASTSVSFDLSVFEIFAPLSCGGVVVLADDALHLATHTAAERVTLVNTVPSAMVELLRLQAVGEGVLSVNLAGETLKRSLVQDIYSQTNVELVRNLYGPTEYTTYSTGEDVQRDCDGEPTIGRPIANTQTYILDQAMTLTPVGVVGEIFIGGHGLARGYLNRPDLTADRFLPDSLSGQTGSRLYRTGDLGKFLDDGRIEYLGRKDHQVKIRGYRIELGEIETALEQHDSIREAVVIASGEAGEQRLVAYVVALGSIDRGSCETELRRSLHERLPAYMAPSAFVFLGHLPLTANGKVDRRALPVPERFSHERKEGFVEARTVTEQLLAQIWSEVLKAEPIGIHDNFFELGGHSLLAAQVVSRIRAAFQIELPLRSLFETPTIDSLAQTIETQTDTAIAGPIDRVPRDVALPLSFAQQRLWFLDQLDPHNSAYNLSMALRLEGRLNTSALEESLNEIVRRHEVLRTRFVAEDGPPRQVIEAGASAHLVTIDLSGLPAGVREEEAQGLFALETQRPFSLSEPRLLRLMLLKLEDDKHWLVLVAHHIIADGWSVGIFTRELTQLYRAFSQGEDSPLLDCAIQYADFATWQRNWLTGQRLADELSYWREQLSDAPALLELPTDHPRPAVQTFRGADVAFSLSSTLTDGLKSLCRTHAVTPFMALTAAFAMLLSRYSRQPDVCIGTPVAGRTRLETEDLIGLFVNTLVLRTRFTNELTFRDLLAQVREVTLQADAHQHLPFEKLVDELQPERTLSYSPFFQAMFVLQNTPAEELDIHGLSLSRIDAEAETAQFDLIMRVEERAGEFTGRLNYNTDLFERATIERMTRHFQQLLGEMVRDTEQQVAEVRMLSAAEREQLIVEWNRLDQQDEVAGGLMARFERAVKRFPEAIALKDGDDQVSYRELNRRANQLGHYLRRMHRVGPEVRVGLLLDRSVEMIVSILGVLKAGGAYVPMELSAPAERIAYMLEDSGCTLLLTEKQQFDLIGETATHSTEILTLDELSEDITAEPESDLDVPVSEDNVAYMIYTSGSTGRPKGVMVTHANVLRLLATTERWYGFGNDDVWTMFHSYAFDVSVWELWGALLYGGRLVVVPYWVSRTPEAYYELLQREHVTVLNQTPSAFRQVQPLLEQGSAGQLRLVIFAGEALELNSLKSWYERFGNDGPQLVNMYGITETTVHSTYRPLRQVDVIEARGSMVGRRIPDLEIYLLDERQEPVPVGVPGELYVGGDGVARGYLNRPELTAERFIAHPFSTTGERLYRSGDLARYLDDGDIEYLGRIDHQVKIRGYRIETGEIESVLASYPGVRKAVVIPREFETGHKYLAAYVTGDGGPGTDGLRNYLEAKLPAYMVPSALMWVDSIKLTTNGKIDRKSLPEPARDSNDKAYVAAGTPAEKILAAIWQDTLKVERVGVNDNFFELGGDSILTTHVVAAARRGGLQLTPQQFFQQQTLGKLALVAEEAVPATVRPGTSQLPKSSKTRHSDLRWASLSADEIENIKAWTDLSNVEDSYPLTSFQQGILFHILDRPAGGIYLNQQSYTLKGKLDVQAFQKAFQEVVNRHQILRTAFILSAKGGPLQMVFRQVNLPWAMYDWTHIPAAEADEHLALLQQAEYGLGFELSRAPLMRLTLVQRDADLYEFIWSYHLLLLDGASGAVVFKELLEFYEGFQARKPVELKAPVRYGDYVDWLQQQEQREAEAYWRQTLARFSSPTSLGFDRAEATIEQKDYTEQFLLLDHALTTELRSFAARSHLTLNTLIQGAWALLLSRRSGSDDVVFGNTVSGRLAEFPGAESTVGLFVNVLPARVRLPRDAALKTWLSELQSQQAEARRFEFCALPDIQGWSEVPRGQPLFESVLIHQNIPLDISLSESVGLKVLGIRSTERTNVPLAVIIEPGSQLRFKIVYQRTRFDDVTIERIIQNLHSILISITTNSEATLSSLSTREDVKTSLIESFNQVL